MEKGIDAANFNEVASNLPEPISIGGKPTTVQYKDTFFRTIFKDPSRALDLYNSLVQTDYVLNTDIKMIKANPIMAMSNDISFIIEDKLVVFIEHQSTINSNMPLRMLFYIRDALYTLIDSHAFYRPKLLKVPTPEVFVLYNGNHDLKQSELRLSDAYMAESSNVCLELVVPMIDIRYNSLYNSDSGIKRCDKLMEYSYLIECIREFLHEGYSRDEAIKKAVDCCISNNVLVDYLLPEYKEVLSMLNGEYDLNEHIKCIEQVSFESGKEEGFKEGREEGREEGLIAGIERSKQIRRLYKAGKSVEEICQETDCDEKYIRLVLEDE